jgi:lipopolysaccharide transport system ATP-binding protein
MYVRLAFAVAAHLEPEILIIDEVLAVGDAEFQKKCLGKMSEAARAHRTVLFVSHNLAAVEQLCSHALLLDGGQIRINGDVRNVVSGYLSTNSKHAVLEYLPESDSKRGAEVIRIALCDENGNPLKTVTSADSPNLRIELVVHERRRDLKLSFVLYDMRDNPIFASCPLDDGVGNPTQPGHYEFQAAFPRELLMPQRYSISVSVYASHSNDLHQCPHALAFDVQPGASQVYSPEPGRFGVIQIPCKWTHRVLSTASSIP